MSQTAEYSAPNNTRPTDLREIPLDDDELRMAGPPVEQWGSLWAPYRSSFREDGSLNAVTAVQVQAYHGDGEPEVRGRWIGLLLFYGAQAYEVIHPPVRFALQEEAGDAA